jgi:adenylate cyclase class 2
MSFINIEIKARCGDPNSIRQILNQRNAIFKGEDHQIDTYFKCHIGRLKLRQGNIENHLIHYEREDQSGPKKSVVTLYRSQPGSTLKEILTKSLGILVIVDKRREIYFIDNIKFHIDSIEKLGSFIEIEAIDRTGQIGEQQLRNQCEEYIRLFKIQPEHLIDRSYSDLLLDLTKFEVNQ